MADVCPKFAQSQSSAVDTRRHHCECLCQHCERNGSGWFAQRAALDGDPVALGSLSPALGAALVPLNRGGRRRGCNRPVNRTRSPRNV